MVSFRHQLAALTATSVVAVIGLGATPGHAQSAADAAASTFAMQRQVAAEPTIRVGALSREGLGAGQDVGYFLVDPRTGDHSSRPEIYQGLDHRLSPKGTTVATSLALSNPGDNSSPAGYAITLQNLTDNSERILIEDAMASGPMRLGWSADSTRLFYVTDGLRPQDGSHRMNPPRLWIHTISSGSRTGVDLPTEFSYKRVMGDVDDGSLLVETSDASIYRMTLANNTASLTRVAAPVGPRDSLLRSASFDPFSDRLALGYDGSRAADATFAEKERSVTVLDLTTGRSTDWGVTRLAIHEILLLPGATAILYQATRSDGFAGYTALISKEASGAETELRRAPSSEPGLRARYEQMSAAVASGTVAPGDGTGSGDGSGSGSSSDSGVRSLDDACPAGTVPDNSHTDHEGNTHDRAIACVVWWEIAQGRTSTAYEPRVPVNREQMAGFVARLIEKSGGNLQQDAPNAFSDDDTSFHHKAINALAAAGVVDGTGGGRYSLRQSSPERRWQSSS